jgi:putative peptidoglycan lipid II flippase
MDALRATLAGAVRLVFALTLPATFGLWALSGPLVRLLYQRGEFQVADTDRTAAALSAYCVGLCAYAAVKVLVPAFYALGDTKTPVRASFLSVAVNLAGNLALMGPLGHVGLALSTSLTMLFNFGQLSWALRRRLGRFEGRRLLSTVLRTGGAAAVMAIVIRLGVELAIPWWRGSFQGAALVVGGGIAVGVVATWGLYRLLRVAELPDLEAALGGFGRRLGRGRPPGGDAT